MAAITYGILDAKRLVCVAVSLILFGAIAAGGVREPHVGSVMGTRGGGGNRPTCTPGFLGNNSLVVATDNFVMSI